MIPLTLQIKNFLSYGPDTQEIDFTKYQMICLSGKNGHGKSALLDAMTWAVWGQARKSSGQPKPDAGLLHLGERNMKVIFDFEFNHKRYRVRREFTFAYGKQTAYLEFGMFNTLDDAHGTGELISLTDKTIRKTQDKIELLLGLDFDSFINSAFIRQGNSGEFSQKSPKERKEILGNILGLNTYDQLRKAASEKSKLLENERQALLKLSEHLQLDLGQAAQVQDLAQSLETRLAEIKNEQLVCDLKIQACYSKQKDLETSAKLAREERANLTSLELVYDQDLAKLSQLKVSWRDLLFKLKGILNKQVLQIQKTALEAQIQDLRLKQKNNWHLREQLVQFKADHQKIVQDLLNKHDGQISSCRFDLEKIQNNLLVQQTSYDKILLDLTNLKTNRVSLFNNLQACSSQEAQHDLLQKKFERYKDFYQRLIVIGNLAKLSLDDLDRKQLYIDQNCPACPLCEQNLSAARKRFLAEQFATQTSFAANRVLRVTKLLKDLKAKIYDQHALLEKLKENLQRAKILQVQIDQDDLKISDLEKCLILIQVKLNQEQELFLAQKNILQTLISERDNLLKNHHMALKLEQDIKNCEENLLKNNYQEANLQELEASFLQINNLLNIDQQQDLDSQRVRILEQVHGLVQLLKQNKKIISDLKNRLKQDLNFDQEKANLTQELNSLLPVYHGLKTEHDQVIHQLGSVQEQLNKIVKTKRDLDKLRSDLIKLENASNDYRLLVGAFGKDGIQALLIEEAIPEIEQEANYLLGRLTDNQAQLFIESLRDLKSGGTKETLDIKISDNVGLRPYEMFSGGEAFRIDFALRIAISKLLARRAGTALQTLIIDEGFGSQDEEGLAHIMEALYKIQDDFAKIIVVSHLNSMKEQFPVHFFITKNPSGSTVSVIEQG